MTLLNILIILSIHLLKEVVEMVAMDIDYFIWNNDNSIRIFCIYLYNVQSS